MIISDSIERRSIFAEIRRDVNNKLAEKHLKPDLDQNQFLIRFHSNDTLN